MNEFVELKEHLINLSFEFKDIWVVNDDLVNMEWNVTTRNYYNKKISILQLKNCRISTVNIFLNLKIIDIFI